jgi:hypothetical protein
LRLIVGRGLREQLDALALKLQRVDRGFVRRDGAYFGPPSARSEIREVVRSSSALQKVRELVTSCLDEGGYALLSGLPADDRPAWALALGEALGVVLDDVEAQPSALLVSEVRPGAQLQGSQLRELDLHTDYSMWAEPPRLTLLRNIAADPTPGLGLNGVVDTARLLFRHEGTEDCDLWCSSQLPFAATAQSGKERIHWSPILQEVDSRAGVRVRFHISRIRRGFKLAGVQPSREQATAIATFLAAARDIEEQVSLSLGDVLFIDNHACLHSRGRCSSVVDFDGDHGRDTQVLFLSTLYPSVPPQTGTS